MFVEEIINMAKGSELRNIAVANDPTTILSYINLGMIELYKRFPLSVKEYMIELVGDGSEYILPSDLMYIVGAYGEVPEGFDLVVNELPINEEENPLSVNTVSWNKVQIPGSVEGEFVSIIYVASPEMLVVDDDEAYLKFDIEIPPQMVEALLHYIGYRAHAAMDGNIQAENNTHYSRFEASCKRIEATGMFTSDDLSMATRDLKGFV